MPRTIHLLIKEASAIDREVRVIVTTMFPSFDFSRYSSVFADVEALFSGAMPGFHGCDTAYHDWNHTLGTLLATARLMHGVHVERHQLSARIVEMGLIAALFHDVGYIRRNGEGEGTGARFTRSHVMRGIDVLEFYSDKHGWPVEDFLDMECMLKCTDPAFAPDTIVFTNLETMLAGHVLGTADMVSQMADDIYLEKLPLLFEEFSEAGITEFTSEYDLFLKTMGFYSFMKIKMESRLSDVISCMSAHFRDRHGFERDLYSEAIARNMNYLSSILEKYGEAYSKGLRRRLDRREYPIQIAA